MAPAPCPRRATDPPYTVGSGWELFSWGGPVGTFNSEGPFTFTTAAPVLLKVTDAFTTGDAFNVWDSSTLIGSTSIPTSTGVDITGDPDIAYTLPEYSHGAFLLGPGSYAIEFQTYLDCCGGGGAWFRADVATVTPEPSTLAIAGLSGLIVLVYARRRTRTA